MLFQINWRFPRALATAAALFFILLSAPVMSVRPLVADDTPTEADDQTVSITDDTAVDETVAEEATPENTAEEPAEIVDSAVVPAAANEPTPAAPPSSEDAPSSSQPTQRRPRRNSFQIPDPAADLNAPNRGPTPRDVIAPDNAAPISSAKDSPSSDSEPSSSLEPITLNGVRPGATTRRQLDTAWGEAPESRVNNGIRRTYHSDQYKRVDIIITDNQVSSIIVHLDKPLPPDEVIKQWQLDDLRAVKVIDESGRELGKSFPERGVLFGYARGLLPPKVQQVVLDPIDAQPFVLRAEPTVYSEPRHSLADLDQALVLDPKYARAHWLRAELLSSIGRAKEAVEAAEHAVALEPSNTDFHLTFAKVLEEAGEHARAIKETQSALDQRDAPQIVKAQAMCQLGDLLSAGQDHKQAMDRHQTAIKLATPLANDVHPAVRQTAKQILLNAHLAIAHDIAWGPWQQKSKIVPQWLARASAHADEMIADEGADKELRLRVAERALAACAGAPEQIDAGEWIASARDLGKQLISESGDDLRTQRLQWELGLSLHDALQVALAREQFEQALEYGEEATHNLELGSVARQRTPGQEFSLGRLYYRIGSIYAIHKSDHARAIAWYDKAAQLLEEPLRAGAQADLGRQGESLVSMGVSYWEVGQQEEALRLTELGAQCVSQATDKGIVKQSALAVPYGNLASMHGAFGHKDEAKSFAALAAGAEASAKEARRPAPPNSATKTR